MLQEGDLVHHPIFASFGVILKLYKGWNNKYCDVFWIHTGIISTSVKTSDLKKVS